MNPRSGLLSSAALLTAALLSAALTPAFAQGTAAPAVRTPSAPSTPAVSTPAASTTPAPRVIPAANYVALGVLYYDQGNYDSAYLAFRAASERDPRNAEALLGLGRTQTKLRLFAASIDTLRRLVTQDPKNTSAFIALAQAYQAQYVGTSDRSRLGNVLDAALGTLNSAETAIRAAGGSSLNVNLSKVYNERGYVYRLLGDNKAAIMAFQQATTLNPDNAVILYNLGDMYYSTGDLTNAIDSLQRAVIADPRDSYSRAYYAKLLAVSGNTAAAKPEAAQAARLAPGSAYAVGQYGVVSYLAHDPGTAQLQLQAALKLDPIRYPEFYYYLGRLELDQGQLSDARADLTKAAALASTTPEYQYYLGLSYERSFGSVAADVSKAREAYSKALALDPNYKLAQDAMNRVR